MSVIHSAGGGRPFKTPKKPAQHRGVSPPKILEALCTHSFRDLDAIAFVIAKGLKGHIRRT